MKAPSGASSTRPEKARGFRGLALLLALGVSIVGCGNEKIVTKTVTVEHRASVAGAPGQSARDSSPTSTSSSKPAGVPAEFARCDANIAAKKGTTSCGFASNTFYAYFRGHGASVVRAYSPAIGKVFTAHCDSRETRIECATDDGGVVRFSRAAIDDYSSTQADAYAANHDLGPDPSKNGSAPSNTAPRRALPQSSPGTQQGSDFCDTHDCIPNYPNGNGSTVQCADGTYSQSGGIQGACSHHGGVG